MNLKPRFMLLTITIFILSTLAVSYSVTNFSEKIIELWAPRFIAKQALYDKSRTLQPILYDLKLSRQLASSQIIIDWAHSPDDPELIKKGLAELENYRNLFEEHNYFAAFSGNNAYYHNNASNSFKDKPLRYTLNSQKDSDNWFYNSLYKKRAIRVSVNPNIELGITQLWTAVLIKDGDKILGIIGTGHDVDDFISNIPEEEDPGITSLFVDHSGTIQIHRSINVKHFGSVTAGEKEHENIDSFFTHEGATEDSYQAMKKLESGEDKIITRFLTIEGKKKLLGITYIPEISWHIFTLIDLNTILPMSEFKNIIIVYILTLLFAFILFNFALNKVVLTPLGYLFDSMAQIEKGEEPQGYLVHPPRGEIGRLIKRFTQMAQSIIESRHNLEKKVQSRTIDLERLAQIDPLTELYNRRGMTERMNQHLNRAEREKTHIGILWLDVDWFKDVNDTFGHAIGDEALKTVANHIKKTIRSYDIASQWGGDEFLILLQDADQRILFDIAERLRLSVAHHIFTTENLTLTISIGGALSQKNQTIDSLYKVQTKLCTRLKRKAETASVWWTSKISFTEKIRIK